MVAELAAGALDLQLEQLVLPDGRLVRVVRVVGDREPVIQITDALAVLIQEPLAELLCAAVHLVGRGTEFAATRRTKSATPA